MNLYSQVTLLAQYVGFTYMWRVGTDVHPKFNPEYGVQLAIYIIMLGFRSTEERSALTQNLDFTCIYRK